MTATHKFPMPTVSFGLTTSVRPEVDPLSFAEKEGFLSALPLRWRPYFEVAFGPGSGPRSRSP